MAAYLVECAHAPGAITRARNLSQLARDIGMTRAGLSRALAYDGNPASPPSQKSPRRWD